MKIVPPHICHLTVLNPALHGRIFYKEALSMQHSGYRVTVVGLADSGQAPTGPAGLEHPSGVRLHLLQPTGRWGLSRWLRPWQILRLAWRQRADVYHIHTPELLWVAALLRVLLRSQVVYDVHEDYAANFLYYGVYPPGVRHLLAAYVKALEWASRLFVSLYVLAEDCYQRHFPAKRSVVVANKVIANPPPTPLPDIADSPIPTLLYTGTWAPVWGLDQTIDLWEALQSQIHCRLIVAGHGIDAQYIRQITNRLATSPFRDRIQIMGGSTYVPYPTIRQLQASCTAILALYPVNRANRERIPTKFYEAMSVGKPLIFTSNPTWNRLNGVYYFGMAIADVDDNTLSTIAEALRTGFHQCYPHPLPPSAYAWQEEAARLLKAYKTLVGT